MFVNYRDVPATCMEDKLVEQPNFDVQKYWESVNSRRRSIDWLRSFYIELNDSKYCNKTPEHISRSRELEWIRQRIKSYRWRSLIDCGCGPGFWFQLWHDLDLAVRAVDRAEAAVPRARLMAEMLEAAFSVQCAPLTALPFETSTADVAVTVKVLIHTPKEEIVESLREIGRIANYIMILEARYDHMTHVASHVFDHDYEVISRSLGYQVLEQERTPRREIFMVIRTKNR